VIGQTAAPQGAEGQAGGLHDDPRHCCAMLVTAMGLDYAGYALEALASAGAPAGGEVGVARLRVAGEGMIALLTQVPKDCPPETRRLAVERGRVAVRLQQAQTLLLRAGFAFEAAAGQAAEQAAEAVIQRTQASLRASGRSPAEELEFWRARLAEAAAQASPTPDQRLVWEHWLEVTTNPQAARAYVEALGGGPSALQSAQSALFADTPGLRRVLAELDGLIGLKQVKQQVRTIANLLQVLRARRDRGMKVTEMSHHMVFLGTPGTGKTTVARLLAQVFKELRLLDKGHLVETDRGGLVGEYVGHTAIKTGKVIDSALGGVLFVDEAYALADRGGNDFGREAIDTLLKRMEDDRGKFVVIVAGYEAEMERFLRSNPGLESRFNERIRFPDYGPGELLTIFETRAADSGYELSSQARERAAALLRAAWEQRDERFGNARMARNLFEKAVAAHANRVAGSLTASDSPDHTRRVLSLLLPDDLPPAP
jgi:stage V sporulation protein K